MAFENFRNILIFGASGTWGALDPEGGWVDRVKRHFFDRDFVYNLGVSSDTSELVFGRFESETKARVDEDGKTIVIFEVGKNDSFLVENREPQISLKNFVKNLESILEKTKSMGAEAVFLTVIPCDETKTLPVSWDSAAYYTNASIDQYNQAIRDFCAKYKVFCIDTAAEWKDQPYRDLLADGLHPNTEGHGKIARAVISVLENL